MITVKLDIFTASVIVDLLEASANDKKIFQRLLATEYSVKGNAGAALWEALGILKQEIKNARAEAGQKVE